MKKLLFETNISKMYMVILLGITVLSLVSYYSYAMFTVNKEKENAITIITGNLTGALKVDGTEANSLSINSGETKIFTVELSNNNESKARYNFYYTGNLPAGVTVGYVVEEGYNIPPSETGVNLEANGTMGSSNIYRIKVKNSSSNNVTINLGYQVGLDYNDLTLPSGATLFEESIDLDPVNEPVLDSGMIAVTYNGNSWVKADTSSNWYNYNNGNWANAVTVSATTRDTYQSAEAGTEINMDDIETMWVWIPRYSYTIGSEDGTNYYGKQGEYSSSAPTQTLPGEIDIKFVDTNTKEKGTAKYIVSEGIQENSWYTPDAFTFGSEELSGIWVGKFETSSSKPDTIGGNTTELDPMIKPFTGGDELVMAWHGISVSNAFTVSQKMNDAGNRYGLSESVDTHMMKNSEWAAVAYLSQSKYGKLGNENFTGANKRIYINYPAFEIFFIGCSCGSGNVNSCSGQYLYNVEVNGTGASTTGTIYGVYDMNGGIGEYVMGNYNDVIGNSGFSSMPEAKYYDKYEGPILDFIIDPLTACNGRECLSHGLSETEGWYDDGSFMLGEDPWLLRGPTPGHYNENGVFSFWAFDGGTFPGYSFRLAMSP